MLNFGNNKSMFLQALYCYYHPTNIVKASKEHSNYKKLLKEKSSCCFHVYNFHSKNSEYVEIIAITYV